MAAALALGFLIVVHEAGHYVVARWCGMHVERFSIGFGPGILKRRLRRTGTIVQLAPIPFGGFVEIRGMNLAEEVDPEDVGAYPNRPAWQRFVTIFAGPATNYVAAIALAMILFTCRGVATEERYGYLEQGDRIVRIDGAPYVVDRGASLSERVSAKHGGPLTLTLERGGVEREVAITPKLVEGVYRLGIRVSVRPAIEQVGIATAVWHAVKYPVEETAAIARGLYRIITGTDQADVGGPYRIVEELRLAFTASWVVGIELLMMLSVYLGLFNLLPLPALDGGRLVFLGYELITRRRANPKLEAVVHMSGILLLGSVMILVTLKDCGVV